MMNSCASQYSTKNGCRMGYLTDQQFDGIKYLEQIKYFGVKQCK